MRESNLRERNAFSESTIGADDAERRIARALGICVGNYLREMYSDRLKEPIPPKLADLLRRLDAGCSIPTSDRSLHLSRNSNPALGDWARRTMMCGNENGRRRGPTVLFPNHKPQAAVKSFDSGARRGLRP